MKNHRIRLEFQMLIDDKVTNEQIEKWLRYELNDVHQLPIGHPMFYADIEPTYGTLDINIEKIK